MDVNPSPVFDSDDLPERMLRVHRTLPANTRDLGAQIHYLTQDVFHEIAARIAKDPGFVKLIPSDGTFIHLSVDYIVLTTDEYAELCRAKFREGMEHARRFLP